MSNKTTQINESINSSIVHYRDKDNHFTVSNDARSSLAIRKTNDYHFESHIIDEILQDHISQEAIDMLRKDEEITHKQNESHKEKIKCKKEIFIVTRKEDKNVLNQSKKEATRTE